MLSDRPTTLLAELTHRCPLHCPYCSNPLDLLRAEAELTTGDWKRVFSEARALGVLQLGLSGGEPLLRKDLEELAEHARGVGLYSTLVTSGLGLTRTRAERLKEAGLEHIQISLQDSDPVVAERIAGVKSVKHKQAAAALVRELGFAFTVNVVLHRANLDRIESIIDLAADLGADRIELANTQY
jgi:PqqA peptide cyclase